MVKVAEYYGQRVDVGKIELPHVKNALTQQIVQLDTIKKMKAKEKKLLSVPKCPFSPGNSCKKLNSGNHPVCSVRKSDDTLWVVCSERLCSSNKKNSKELGEHQKKILLDIAKHLYDESVDETQVCFKREVRLKVNDSTKYNADFIMSLAGGRSDFPGPTRLVLEMQGGGETSNTGDLSRHLDDWLENKSKIDDDIKKTGTLETNAWRRQQEQFIVKGNIAMKTWRGYGIAFCVGTLLYDYLMNKIIINTQNDDASNSENSLDLDELHKKLEERLPSLRKANWTLAVLGICEDKEHREPGPIQLKVDEKRMLFTNYQTFVQALINQGEPSKDAFCGTFYNLKGEKIEIKGQGS